MMLRIVLDTNIYVSAILRPDGTQAKLIKFAMEDKFKLVFSVLIFQEIQDVLKRLRIKKYLTVTQNEIERFFYNIYINCIFVKLSRIIRAVKNDPDDDIIVSTAVKGDADYIISGDKHLLELKKFRGIKILNANDFLKTISC